MRRRSFTFGRVTDPLRAWSRRFMIAILIGLSLGLIVISRFDPGAVSRARSLAQDLVAPVMVTLSRPVHAARDLSEEVKSYGELRAEVEALREQNETLRVVESRVKELEAENRRFRDMVRMVEDEPYQFLTARVISEQGSAFEQSLLVSAGKDHGVRRGLPVMASTGLVGRVLDVGLRSSRVLLITDSFSRVPVIVERTGAPAVMTGNNSATMELRYLTPDMQAAIKPGDRVVTSGSGGAFPYGLPAGTVTRAGPTGVFVQPIVDWERRLFMRVVDYNIQHFLPDSICSGVTAAR